MPRPIHAEQPRKAPDVPQPKPKRPWTPPPYVVLVVVLAAVVAVAWSPHGLDTRGAFPSPLWACALLIERRDPDDD